MVQRKKSKISLLFLMALVPCLCLAQTNNAGVLSVKTGTLLSVAGAFENKQNAELINNGNLYVYGDFTNNGRVGFTPGQTTGKTSFKSSKLGNNLSISGTGTSEFNDVEFNNINPAAAATAGFSLGNRMSVFGVADFKKGLITYPSGSSNLLTFEDDATAVNVSENSFVNGFSVVKKGNKKFTYPVGDWGKYRPVSISAPENGNAGVFSGQYFKKSPDSSYPVANIDQTSSLYLIDNAEYWEVKKTDGGSGTVLITLRMDETTTPAEILNGSKEDIHIARWDATKNVWVDEGGRIDLDNNMEVVSISQSGGGIYTLARTNDSKTDVILESVAISPNDDSKNDELIIKGLDAHPNNKLTIYDRLGKVMFDTISYNTSGNVFKGYMSDGNVLPLGTYFYTVNYVDQTTGRRVIKTNYLYINLR